MEDLGQAMKRAAVQLGIRALQALEGGSRLKQMAGQLDDAILELMLDPDMLFDVFGLPYTLGAGTPNAHDGPITARDLADAGIGLCTLWAQTDLEGERVRNLQALTDDEERARKSLANAPKIHPLDE